MPFGVILIGLGSLVFGPAFTVVSSMVGYLSGNRSGASALVSVALAGVLDLAFDCSELGFDIDNRLDPETCDVAVALAGGIMDVIPNDYFDDYDVSRRPDGLSIATLALVDVSSGTPNVSSIWSRSLTEIADYSALTRAATPQLQVKLPGSRWLEPGTNYHRLLSGANLLPTGLKSRRLANRRLNGF